jgi:UDP-N-acetylmuramoyl-L-alanyl-D-glutamate--2,6-diaminopimelate ligase
MSDVSARPSVVAPRRVGSLLERLAHAGLTSAQLTGDADAQITGITHDSRQVRPGDLYVARAGANTHGIAHVGAAVGAGAAAVLTDRASAAAASEAGAAAVVVVDNPRTAMGPAAAWTYCDPAESMTLFGVTGTNGKTTTSYLIDAGLRGAGLQTGLIGTIETRIGDEVVPSARTTPEATDLHALLALMRERGVDAVAMEVSSHALALGRVDGVVFDVAGFTNLSQDHLDFHGDMADYFAAKASLFTPARSHRAVVNIDDEWGMHLSAQASVPLTTTGARVEAMWRRGGERPATATSRGSLWLASPSGGQLDLECALLGRVNLVNAALALLMLLDAGIDPAQAKQGIASLAAVPGRLERVDIGAPFLSLVDYAHTPGAVTAMLADARALAAPGARVLVVLGCGGDRDRDKRPMMGAAAATGADFAVFTNDNPRSEDPGEILAAMQSGVPAGARVLVEPDRARAIDAAVGMAKPGDVLVVAGKGHEQGQENADGIVPFDDRFVLQAALLAHLGAW